MKYSLIWAVALFTAAAARADIDVVNSQYAVIPYYTDAARSADDIGSYDWDQSGNLYYAANTPDFTFDGFYEEISGSTMTIAPASSDFSGASVVSIGNYFYYNTSSSVSSNENIFKYGPVNGSPTLVLTSTTPNSGLYTHQGALFITGAVNFGPNQIYYSALNPDGSLSSDPAIDLGSSSSGSGPLAFDSAGDLFYAPGFGDLSIYFWSAAQVAAAISDPTGNPLNTAGHLWLDYSSLYAGFGGATSMIDSNGELLVTITNFSGPSVLAGFGVATTGTYNGNATTILDDSGILGELGSFGGKTYLSSDNEIVQVVPEPAPSILIVVCLALFALRRWRGSIGRKQGIASTIAAACLLSLAAGARAGPYSPTGDVAGSVSISATSSSIVEWASGVSAYNPGPVNITNPGGTVASFGTPSNALGPADATPGDSTPVVSLGDGGSITVDFSVPIINGPGPDFAVFENGIKASDGNPSDYFLELGFVAVSSDGINFFTFPSVSLTQTTTQVAGFGFLDPTNIYDLAGKDIAGYGTPFDLQELNGVSPLLNINDILYVRVTDVVGDIDPAYATHDSEGNIINDPFPTNLSSGGFDLDAVGVLQEAPEPAATSLLLAAIIMICVIRRKKRAVLSPIDRI